MRDILISGRITENPAPDERFGLHTTAGHVAIRGAGQAGVASVDKLTLAIGHQKEGFFLLGRAVLTGQAVGVFTKFGLKRGQIGDGRSHRATP